VLVAATLLAVTVAASCTTAPPPVVGLSSPTGTYRADDGSLGKARDILPAGENGLVTAESLSSFGSSGTYPPNFDDQLGPYNSFIYGASHLSDANLKDYYLDESFGIRPADVVRTEHPDPRVRVVIYRDGRGIPHIYGASLGAMAFGAGYAGAEDRLFLMDLLRHYGEGDLMSFVGDSCSYESMDYQAIMSKGYTQADLQAQLDAMPRRYGEIGSELVAMIDSYVAGVNRYIEMARQDPAKMPVEFLATHSTPALWKPTDVVAISTLIALEATGGGAEVQNAALLEYLEAHFGATDGRSMFTDLKEQNDPAAPTVIPQAFPYMIPSGIDPSLTALPDRAPTSLSALAGAPREFTASCTGGGGTAQAPASATTAASTRPGPGASPPSAVETAMASLRAPGLQPALAVSRGRAEESNAVVVSAGHSADGHPIAVFGPELGYYDPEILMQEDLHAPGYDAAGAAFPGANFVIELGRGTDYAWSATTASTDQVDMRVEKLCKPGGGTPEARATYYEYRGRCTAMTTHVFSQTWPGSPDASITRTLHYTVHGVVQGWATVDGQPVAIARQDATAGHDLDQFASYLQFGMPSVSSTPGGWMAAGKDIAYSFNWLYLNPSDIAYYVSGRDPLRNPHADPNLPTWGTGAAEWRGFLPDSEHPHAVNPPQGYLVSWNNKPAPGFSASDDLYAWGPVFRSQLLTDGLSRALAAHRDKLDQAQLAAMVEGAATQDLDGYTLIGPVLALMSPALGANAPPGVQQMVTELRRWAADGYHRKKAAATATQYQDAAAVAIWDQVYPGIVRAFFDPIFASGGIQTYMGLPNGYDIFPMLFAETPNDTGKHDGDGFYSGWEGYILKAVSQLSGRTRLAQPLSQAVMSRICGAGTPGPSGPQPPAEACRQSLLQAFSAAYAALVAANGGSTDVSGWTEDANTVAASSANGGAVSLPQYDGIQFQQVGALPLPAMDWQNRPTYQQVVEFPRKIGS
jgi:acyl-homoserine lactone acylase PvdQ